MKARRVLRTAMNLAAAALVAIAGTCGVAHAQGGGSAATATTAASGAAAAASGASAAAAALPVIGQYTVRAGQSLHDVAVDVTLSHDKTVLARASQALFDANPAAFMKHDPSRLKVGAVLNVPGTPDMASAAAGASGASEAAPGASAPVAAASAPASAVGAAPASGAGGSHSAANAVANTAASAAAAAPASAAASAGANAGVLAASGAAGASASLEAGASAAVASTASGASAETSAGPASASDAHSWSGAIQTVPAAASGASATSGAAASAPVTVSSLQQLLALKNRVLMALQQHGIGKQAQMAGAPAGTAGTHGGVPVSGAVPGASAAQPEVSPVTLGVVAALVLAVVALIVRLLMRKRRKPASASAIGETAAEPPRSVAPPSAALQPEREDAPTPPAATLAAGAAAIEAKAETSAEPPQHDAALDHATDAASLSAAAELGGEALPPLGFEAPQGSAQDGPAELRADRVERGTHPHGVEPGEPQSLADATDAASLAAAAELGASALPPAGLAGLRTVGEMEELARQAEAQDGPKADAAHEANSAEPHPIELTMPGAEAERHAEHEAKHPPEPQAPTAETAPGAPTEPAGPALAAAPHLQEPEKLGDEAAPEASPESFAAPAVPLEQKVEMPYQEVQQQEVQQQEVPQEFPKSAVEALGGLDMPLPPRVETPMPMPGVPLSTEPVATPETIARQAPPFAQPPEPPAGEAIEAGTAGAGAIAGLGAPRFGTLTLDFDLNLPADSAEPLPVFTPDQLSRIARNKLDLAHEYIALGDLGGARTLINEVIESNDHATRADAQALLSTLSPLS
ncbi:FimV/HubP family polar landmark protein [Paraburkholderia sp. J63]|uniref:FimV/HubP family polar landmark protein n=1 Tax=Paraburkholderia sp. J63 TaxID=2805434 RepID=UPI002ABDBFA7|nr:FimV/HubP family polar landmark protein [Paraburkholderia sp. J63]